MTRSSCRAASSSRWWRKSELTATSHGGQPATVTSRRANFAGLPRRPARARARSSARELMSRPVTETVPHRADPFSRRARSIVTSPPPLATSTTSSPAAESCFFPASAKIPPASRAAVRERVLIVPRATRARRWSASASAGSSINSGSRTRRIGGKSTGRLWGGARRSMRAGGIGAVYLLVRRLGLDGERGA